MSPLTNLAGQWRQWPDRDNADGQWALVTGPAQEPITVREAKQHARIVQSNDDAVIASYIRAAREEAEEYMSRGLFTQTWTLTLRTFSDVIWLPRAAPLQNDANASPSTAPVVQYYDANGALQTLANTFYLVDTVSRPGRILRAPNQTWPTLRSDQPTGRVVITYVIGWTDVAQIPERIKQGIRLYVAYLDCDRDGSGPTADKARMQAEACWDDRVRWIESHSNQRWPLPWVM